MVEGRIGFIGAGNMASALMRALVTEGFPASRIICSDIDDKKLQSLSLGLGVNTTRENTAVPLRADIVVLAVKPAYVESVARELSPHMQGKGVVSIAAGVSTAQLRMFFGEGVSVMRTIPNTPSLAGEGMAALSLDHDLTEKQLALCEFLFRSAGDIAWVQDASLDAVTAVSGSGPAYVYLFIEAIADAGVREGLPRDLALRLAAQTVNGAAHMVLSTGRHPGLLKDEVCSPGGTTIAAIAALEERCFRGTVMAAVHAAAVRAAELGRKV